MTEPDNEVLLAAVLAGDVPPDGPAVEALRRRDPDSARELVALLALRDQLDVEAAIERADDADREQVGRVLAALASGATPPARRATSDGRAVTASDASDASEAMDASAERTASSARAPSLDARPARIPGSAAEQRFLLRAAAVVLAAVVALWWSDREAARPADDVLLGADETLVALAPVGAVDDFERFACELPAGVLVGRATLTLRAHDDSPEAPPHLVRELPAASWEPDAATRAALPDDLDWELSVYDGQDSWIGAASARAWRPR